jgi:hypothetical protein
MNKKIIAIGITLVFLIVSFSGCEELEELNKPDYITVTVNCLVEVFLEGNIYGKDILVSVEIIKDGGERVSETIKTDAYGKSLKVVKGTFKLYREQPITCIANVILSSVEQNYSYYTFNSASKTITWNEIYPSSDFGESTERQISLAIFGDY